MRALGVFAAVALAACADPSRENGTALFVTARYDGGLEVAQLFFSGHLMGGSDVFKPSYRPDPPGGALPPPQTVRVLLASGFGGEKVTVEAVGFNADGSPVAYGTADSTIDDGVEVPVEVDLLPPMAVPLGDGGTRSDGGVSMSGTCPTCTGSCCIHILGISRCLSDEPADVRQYFCGESGSTCLGCDPLLADSCDPNRGCQCGDGGACADGRFCYQGHCECGPPSCAGCCTADGFCASGNNHDACGSGGLRCEPCVGTNGAQADCNGGVCTTNRCLTLPTMGAKCLSGMECADAGVMPFCGLTSVGTMSLACTACDLHRSDACALGGCICSAQQQQCKASQVCSPNGCVTAPDELRTR